MITSRATTPETPADFLDLSYEDVDRYFARGEIVKQSKRQDVRRCQIKGKSIVVKCYRAQGLFSAFRILIRSSRPHKSLHYANFLRNHNIACPIHYMVLARNTLRYARTYLLIEQLNGPKLHDFLYYKTPLLLPDKTANAAIETIRSLHALGLGHGDLHTENMIVTDETTVQLIDLDNVRKTRRSRDKDITRFSESVERGHQNVRILLDKLKILDSPRK